MRKRTWSPSSLSYFFTISSRACWSFSSCWARSRFGSWRALVIWLLMTRPMVRLILERTAVSWVTISMHSCSSSIIFWIPRSWPSARLRRLRMSFFSLFMLGSLSYDYYTDLSYVCQAVLFRASCLTEKMGLW